MCQVSTVTCFDSWLCHFLLFNLVPNFVKIEQFCPFVKLTFKNKVKYAFCPSTFT